MTYFLRSGISFTPANEAQLDLHQKLPAGNYFIKQRPMSDVLYFEQVEDFPQSGKVYGDTLKKVDRILNTFNVRDGSTGVLLNGEKGSGKTLMAKLLCQKAAQDGVPTIIINQPWCGDNFNQLIQSVDQPAIVLFDEFEKVYKPEQQEAILTLLDGTLPSKKLFILTVNDKWRVDQHMRNRPGRIFYMLDFKGLSCDFITNYCQDRLENQSHIETICKISNMFSSFNFDMLKALVEEMNRYNEGPLQALEMLNARPQNDSGRNDYRIKMSINGVELNNRTYWPSIWNSNPLSSGTITITRSVNEDDDDPYEEEQFYLTPADLKQINSDKNELVYQKDGATFTFSKVDPPPFDYTRFAV